MKIPTTLLHDLCNLPTASFLEDAVIQFVEAWAKERKDISVKKDAFGNRLLTLGKPSRKPRFVLVAHADHPSFVMMEDGYAEFRGGVKADCAHGAKVRFYHADAETPLTIDAVDADDDGRLKGAMFKGRKQVTPGSIGMWDVGGPRVVGDRFSCRVCDDLAGVASAMQAMDLLRRKKLDQQVCLLLTRAEEIGLLGAVFAARDGKLLKESDRIISIETSSVLPTAQQGDGVILRVGDRTSTFHSAFMYFLFDRARTLAGKKDTEFKFQRCLMSGGSCEGTCFDAFGYIAGAVCVALGNYHNMDQPRQKMGPEYISLSDWQNMVRLFVDLAQNLGDFTGEHDKIRQKLGEGLDKAMPLVKNPRQPAPVR